MKKLIIFVVLLNCIVLNAEVVKTKSIPLSIENDFNFYRPIATSLYISCNMIEYESNIAKKIFESTDDQQTLMYKELLTSFRNNDAERALEMTLSTKDTEKVTRYIKHLSESFSTKIVGKDFEKLYIPRQLFFGDDRIIIKASYLGMGGKKLYGSWIRFKEGTEPKLWDFWLKDKYSTSDILYMISHTDELRILKPSKVKILDEVKTDYKFLLPFSTSENPVYLQFNGTVYNDFNLLKDTPDSNDEILNFYQETYQMLVRADYDKLEEGEYDMIADRYTEKSKIKFLENLKKKKPDTKKRIVKFILDADPLFVIFFKSGHGYYNRDHEFIRLEDEGQFKLTHYGFGGELYHFITNKRLFREPVLDIIIGNKYNIKVHAAEKKESK